MKIRKITRKITNFFGAFSDIFSISFALSLHEIINRIGVLMIVISRASLIPSNLLFPETSRSTVTAYNYAARWFGNIYITTLTVILTHQVVWDKRVLSSSRKWLLGVCNTCGGVNSGVLCVGINMSYTIGSNWYNIFATLTEISSVYAKFRGWITMREIRAIFFSFLTK